MGWPVGRPLGCVGRLEGIPLGVPVVGRAVGARQAGYTNGSSMGEFIGDICITLPITHRLDGIVPPKQFPFSFRLRMPTRLPSVDGRLPNSELRSSSIVSTFVRAPRELGRVPTKLFFCRASAFKLDSWPMVDGIWALNLLSLVLRNCSFVIPPSVDGIAPVKQLSDSRIVIRLVIRPKDEGTVPNKQFELT